MLNQTSIKKSKKTNKFNATGGGMRVCSGGMRKFLWVMVFGFIFGMTGVLEAATYSVGNGQPYTNISDVVTLVNQGDIVEIHPGIYNEVMRWQNHGTSINPITIRGVGATKPVIDGNGKNVEGVLPNPRAASTRFKAHATQGKNVEGVLPNPRAIMQFEGDFYIVENLEFIRARNTAGNGAGIRMRGGSNITIRNCLIHDCDMGMMSDGMHDLLVEFCEVHSNGDSTGYAHNFYLGGTSARVQYCDIYNAVGGQNFKCRLHYVELLYNFIHDGDSKEIDIVDSSVDTSIPNSNALVVGNLVIKDPAALNKGQYLIFGQDVGNVRDGTLFCYFNTFIATDSRNRFIWVSQSQSRALIAGNIFYGSNLLTHDANTDGRILAGSTHNWVPTAANEPTNFTNTLKGTDPGFVDPTSRDYHLIQTSPCVDVGVSFNSLSYVDGDGNNHTLSVDWEYLAKLQKVARLQDATPDIGAFEYGTGTINIVIGPASLATGKINEAYSETLTATGGAVPYDFSISVGTLPAGLEIDSVSGEISGTPTEGGFFNITVKVTDSNLVNNTRQYTLRIASSSGGGFCGFSGGNSDSVFTFPALILFVLIMIGLRRRK